MKTKLLFFIALVIFIFTAAGNFRAQEAKKLFTVTIHLSGNGSGEVVSSPAGISCGGNSSDCTESFEKGTPVTLRPRALHGRSEFRGWNVTVGSTQQCAASSNDCNFIVMEDSSAQAQFVAQ
jgi:hypothetical protein